MSESTDKKVQDLKNRSAQLERRLGQKQIKVDFLGKMVKLAEQEDDRRWSMTATTGNCLPTSKKWK